MDTHTRLTIAQCPQNPSEAKVMENKPYRGVVGRNMYACTGTRADIAFPLHELTRFLVNPGISHWNAALRVVRYLYTTKDWSLTYEGKRSLDLELEDAPEGYVDADGQMADDRKAVTGWVFIIDGGAVSWSSRSQTLVSLSTAESEYVAAVDASKEGIWIRSFISQVFEPTYQIIRGPSTLHSDNQAAIAISKDHQFHARTKHIDIRYHFIRYVIEDGKIRLVYCPTEEMVADIMTKSLPSAKAKHFAIRMGLGPV